MIHSQDEKMEALYMEMFDVLHAYARSILNDDSLALEAVQETFCIACSKPESLFSSPNPQGWLMNALKNVISIMSLNRARLTQMVVTTIYSVEAQTSITVDDENVDVLYSDIAESEDFKLIKKLALDRCTMLELSEELGVNIETCKKRVQRARAKLKEKISKYRK